MIRSKRLMYQLFEAGAFGNRPRTWSSLSALLASDYRGRVGLFHKDRRGGGSRVDYHVLVEDVIERVDQWQAEGYRPEDIQFTEMAPHELNKIQGEVTGPLNCPTPEWGWDWSLSFNCRNDLTMRDARAEPWCTLTSCVRPFLRQQLDSASYTNLQRLVEEYPQHVIEFSTFDAPTGVLGWNTIFWEVRLY